MLRETVGDFVPWCLRFKVDVHDGPLNRLLVEGRYNQGDQSATRGETIEYPCSTALAEAPKTAVDRVFLHRSLSGGEAERGARNPAHSCKGGSVRAATILAVAVHERRELTLEFVPDVTA